MTHWRFWESRPARAACEAAHWRVEMEEPDSQARVDAFEAWLRNDPANGRAYAQLDTLAAAGQRLATDDAMAPRVVSRRWWAAGGLAAIAGLAIVGLILAARPGGTVATLIVNQGDAVRTVALDDRSVATLDTNSAIEVDTARPASTVKLIKGRVRLVVHAASGQGLAVVAPATLIRASDSTIDLAIVDGGVRVRLIAGQAAISRNDSDPPRALAVDRSVTVRKGVVVEAGGEGDDPSWTLARMGFDNAPLADILAAANQTGRPTLAVADPAVARLRVTAVLDLRDMHKLARKLAAALDLRVVDRGSSLVLSR